MKTTTLERPNKERNCPNPFGEAMYLADGGMESILVFKRGVELNHFAAFELLNNEEGREEMRRYFIPFLDLAVQYDYHFVAETPTWRASPDWAFKLGYSIAEMNAINSYSVRFLRELIEEHRIPAEKTLVSGNLGPRGDGYFVDQMMTPREARAYHSEQIKTFALADADLVSAFTLNYADEAIGIVLAAREFNIPVVISFTTETDGRLPSGSTLREAIEKTDNETDGYATFFMINCSHTEHFKHVFREGGDWISRVGAIRANASLKSHAELDESETLDSGDRCLLASGYHELSHLLPNLQVVGGCCGTDYSHIAKICEVLFHDDPAKCREAVAEYQHLN
ncbi:homocysteine S-methyltransferase family protein [Halalkalibaculum sp. DA384]|uniref:homocysteine S-methyltransferase family protein n=1 Tax=Halalkalibaculum sp. DA384 TaxID=3373606 RepID=UPI00375495D0